MRWKKCRDASVELSEDIWITSGVRNGDVLAFMVRISLVTAKEIYAGTLTVSQDDWIWEDVILKLSSSQNSVRSAAGQKASRYENHNQPKFSEGPSKSVSLVWNLEADGRCEITLYFQVSLK